MENNIRKALRGEREISTRDRVILAISKGLNTKDSIHNNTGITIPSINMQLSRSNDIIRGNSPGGRISQYELIKEGQEIAQDIEDRLKEDYRIVEDEIKKKREKIEQTNSIFKPLIEDIKKKSKKANERGDNRIIFDINEIKDKKIRNYFNNDIGKYKEDFEKYVFKITNKNLEIGFKNAKLSPKICELKNEYYEKPITQTIRVIDWDKLTHEIKRPYVECSNCHMGNFPNDENIFFDKETGKITFKCACGETKHKIINRDSEKEDVRTLWISDTDREDIIKAYVRGELTGNENIKLFEQGNIKITGIVKAEKIGKTKLIYTPIIDITHIEQAEENEELSEKSIKNVKKITNEGLNKCKEIIIKSVAPHIQGNKYEFYKWNCARVLFGGKYRGDKDSKKIRVLALGEPGTGKTEILKDLKELDNTISYTGIDTTLAGMTTTAMKDKTETGYMIKPGLLPLAHDRVLIIDEFDKLKQKEDIQNAIIPTLTRGIIRATKGGRNDERKADIGLIIGANPKEEHFNNIDPIIKQAEIKRTLWDRMDIILIFTQEKEMSKDLIYHLSNKAEDYKRKITPDDFKTWIKLAREIEPTTTQEMKEKYSDIIHKKVIEWNRYAKEKEDTTNAIYTRQVKTIWKLAETNAKIRLSNTIDEEDIREAINTKDQEIKAIYREFGAYSKLISDRTPIERKKLDEIKINLKSMRDNNGNITSDELEDLIRKRTGKAEKKEIRKFIKLLLKDRSIIIDKNNKIKVYVKN